tara:strand:+ start:2268 stop:3512 length:1245 start_codon:yes stop_codon:yes gene_type:complete
MLVYNNMRRFTVVILFLFLLYLIFFYNQSEGMSNNQELYDKLMDDYNDIFPDSNRNSGGAQFYHHIVTNLKPTKEEYLKYNQFYCAVSGSPIDPNREGIHNYLKVKGVDGKEYYGKYYRCCTPCVCDIMKYVLVEKHKVNLKDGKYEHYVFTINDPCKNESKIPSEVTAFKCKNSKTENGILTKSGRLIIGVLYDVEPYQNQDINDVFKMCEERNSKEPDELQFGMGDIFVKLSIVNQEGFENNLKNIYGESLKQCRKYGDDAFGSWDEQGYCSEKGGGVHQICFDVTKKTENFAKDTGQGKNWSKERVGKNHCMCLGAWALYKAKQDENKLEKTNDELNCEAIPEMSLSKDYIKTWNRWNGNELPKQITNGVNEMVKQCYKKGNQKQKFYLKKKYMDMIKDVNDFKDEKLLLG